MQHFKLVNWWIRGFVFWCHEQVTLVESRTIKDCLVSRTKKGKIRAIGFDSPINEKWNNYVINKILHNNIYCTAWNYVQSPLVIVYLVIVEFPVIVDRLCRPIVYFSMYFSRNSGITHYTGHFAGDGRIHYYERRLYLLFSTKM